MNLDAVVALFNFLHNIESFNMDRKVCNISNDTIILRAARRRTS